MNPPLTAEQVAHALGVSPKTLTRLVREGHFPDAILVSDGVRRWLARDVEAYLHLRGRIGPRRLPSAGAGDAGGENS